LILHTGSITPQFHVVFDGLSVPSIGGESEKVEENLPNHWEQLCLENSTSIPFDNSSKLLQDDWLNAKERELKYCAQQRELKIQETFSLDNSSMNNSERGVRSISLPGTPTQTVQLPQSPQIELEAAVESEQQWIKNMESSDSSEGADVRNSEGVIMKLEDVDKEVNLGPRRFTRSTAGKFLSKRFIEEVFCSIISGSSASSYCSQLMHLAKGNTDVNTGEVRISDPRVYAVKGVTLTCLVSMKL